MDLKTSWTSWITLCFFLPALSASCGSMAFGPPVRPAAKCTLAWDQVDNPSVVEYRVEVWPDQTPAKVPKQSFRVKVPNTAVPCNTAGVTHSGTWQATVQACTQKKICSEPSKPLTFIVSTK